MPEDKGVCLESRVFEGNVELEDKDSSEEPVLPVSFRANNAFSLAELAVESLEDKSLEDKRGVTNNFGCPQIGQKISFGRNLSSRLHSKHFTTSFILLI